jgi:hypothetical protein
MNLKEKNTLSPNLINNMFSTSPAMSASASKVKGLTSGLFNQFNVKNELSENGGALTPLGHGGDGLTVVSQNVS